MKSVNAFSSLDTYSVAPDSDQRDVSGNIESFQMTAASRINSDIDLIKIDETRCIFTVEGGELPVNKR